MSSQNLSIDLDTEAIAKNATDATTAISDLNKQLDDLKKNGKNNTPEFKKLNEQLATTLTSLGQITKALTDYTTALTQQQAAIPKPDAKKNDGQTAAGTTNKPAETKTDEKNNQPAEKPVSTKTTTAVVTGTGSSVVSKDGKPVVTTSEKPVVKNDTNDLSLSDTGKDGSKTNKTPEQKRDDDLKAVQHFYTKYIKIHQDAVDKEEVLLKARNDIYLESATTISGLLGTTTIAGKVALDAKKAFTIAEIGMETEKTVSKYISATASAVEQNLSVPIIGEELAAIDIAWGAAQVAGAIASGIKQAENVSAIAIPNPPTDTGTSGKKAKKARGGIFQSDGMGAYLTGPGTGTSDSINAMLSNGESVINARSTQMFGPILSAINQAGGGVAFDMSGSGYRYASGGLFNGSNTLNDGSADLAQTRAMNDMVKTLAANMPRQVLVVEDVQASLQNKVMLQNMSNF